ncbi:O-antigen ligase family protein [Delftia sp. PS-11]|uniref:O-antigen ligase family protein n=1 Tax=Delftia sp. PS-11 TaxID=2767222 RepID=UPI003AB70CA7
MQLPAQLTTLAAFLVPGLALWLRSGYSYGPALMLLGALCFAPKWIRRRPEPATLWLAALLCAMAVMWFGLSELEMGLARWDRPVKFLLGAVCLFFVAAFPPRPEAFQWGLILGCVGAGGLGLWQVYGQGMDRANGYTNAIQWGNTALLMAIWLGVHMAVYWRQWHPAFKALAGAGMLMGLHASVLSASRGGWAALAAVVPLALFFVWKLRREALGRLVLGMLGMLLAVGLANESMLRNRMELAAREVNQFVGEQGTQSSMGIRLEQYRLAWDMIREKPLQGWGMRGYVQEMQRRVDGGSYSPSIREYNFIHNEILDLWVKMGIAGVLLQMTLFVSIAVLFWPTDRRMQCAAADPGRWRALLALRLSGVLLALCYGIFGMSQQFFVHNSGSLVFVFCLVTLWSGLLGQERAARLASSASTQARCP